MHRRLAVIAMIGTLLLAACGSSDDPAVSGGEAPEDAADDMPAEPGQDGQAEPASCEPAGSSLAVTAEGTKWDTDCLAAPAGQAFSIAMDNKDNVPHSVAILESHSATEVLFRGELVQGPKQTTYQVPALAAGTYVFHCEVHPAAMKGTFVVK